MLETRKILCMNFAQFIKQKYYHLRLRRKFNTYKNDAAWHLKIKMKAWSGVSLNIESIRFYLNGAENIVGTIIHCFYQS
ncbi:Uncharacterised protein [Escherichia coli]|uniref:Uncharacterized protein n=1 Tax=Escherichia coli TaxID=562 RepID=A0A485JMT5_ECOLX|nr:Uncharacterised protein [Escherichia coli]